MRKRLLWRSVAVAIVIFVLVHENLGSVFAQFERPPKITLKLDISNLSWPGFYQSSFQQKETTAMLSAVNQIWNQCGIQFQVNSYQEVEAPKIGMKTLPKGEGDLGKIAEALNPKGFHTGIPFTVSGKWDFYDSTVNGTLFGLGWVFVNNQGVDHIGAMVDDQRLKSATGILIAAHELGHTLSLPHNNLKNNLMGDGKGFFTPEQCAQARGFAQKYLGEFAI